MGLLGDVFSVGSSVAGALGAKSKNKAAKAMHSDQVDASQRQGAISQAMLQYILKLAQQKPGFKDAFGGGVEYDPISKQWVLNLNPQEKGIQAASYDEEAKRYGIDQVIGRQGLIDAERLRQQASGAADSAYRDYANFNSGVGRVDPTTLADTIALNRRAAVNAGYDDANRAANTLSTRQGTSAGDVLSEIARNRTRDIASLGDPTVDALNLSEGINSSRKNDLAGAYNLFGTRASTGSVNTTPFTASGYNQQGVTNEQNAQQIDLSRADTILAGQQGAAGIINNAARTLQGADAAQMANTNFNPWGPVIKNVGQLVDNAAGGGVGGILKKLGIS